MVVACRAAGSERITEPETARHRDAVGDVREGRRALVGGDHEVRIVAIESADGSGRDDALALDVVGDVEQGADVDAVCGYALGLYRIPRAAGGQPARHETALGTDGHDQCVLDVLGLHQPEDLGAEVFPPVGPTKSATRHFAHPQVHAFDARSEHVDLAVRSRQRQTGHCMRVDLQGESGTAPT